MLLWGIIIIVLCMNNFISKWTHDQRVLRRSPEASTEKKNLPLLSKRRDVKYKSNSSMSVNYRKYNSKIIK